MSRETVLVTGATGFLGSHLVRALLPRYDVAVALRSGSDTARIREVVDRVTIWDVDQTDPAKFLRARPVDWILHAATCYGRAGETAAEVVEANLMFPLRLLTAALEHGVSGFLNTDTVARRELNPYALSKKQFLEWLCRASDRISAVNVRLEHFYGPEDDPRKFIPFLVGKMLRNESIDLTDGRQERDFLYIDDVVAAFLTVLEKGVPPKNGFWEYGLGSETPVSIRSLVERLRDLCGSGSRLNFGAVPRRSHEIDGVNVDIAGLRSLGWSPQISLEQGLEKTVAWEKSRLRGGMA